MTSQKHVVLSTNNIAGAGGVLITDITVDAETVVLTAEHGGQLKLPLKNCVGRLFASTMGDTVMLNYVQQSFDMPLMPQPVPGFGHYHYGVSAPVGGSIFGISVETMVESQVSALFQSPLTTRLIEPLRKVAREMTDPHPETFTPFGADTKTAPEEQSGTAIPLMFNGEKVTLIKIDHPATKIVTDRSEVNVDTVRLGVSSRYGENEIKLFTLDRANFDENRIREVANVLHRFNPLVSNEYVRYMGIMKDQQPIEDIKFADSAGKIYSVKDVRYEDGMLKFLTYTDSILAVNARHLAIDMPSESSSTLSAFNSPVTEVEVVNSVFELLLKVSPQAAEEYVTFMTKCLYEQ